MTFSTFPDRLDVVSPNKITSSLLASVFGSRDAIARPNIRINRHRRESPGGAPSKPDTANDEEITEPREIIAPNPESFEKRASRLRFLESRGDVYSNPILFRSQQPSFQGDLTLVLSLRLSAVSVAVAESWTLTSLLR